MSRYIFSIASLPLDANKSLMSEAKIWIGENRGYGGVQWETWKRNGDMYEVEISPLPDNPFNDSDMNRLASNIELELGIQCSWRHQ